MRCLIILEANVGGRKLLAGCDGRPTPDAGKSAVGIGNGDVSVNSAAGEIGSAVITASKPPGGAMVSVLTLPGAISEFLAAVVALWRRLMPAFTDAARQLRLSS